MQHCKLNRNHDTDDLIDGICPGCRELIAAEEKKQAKWKAKTPRWKIIKQRQQRERKQRRALKVMA